MLEKYNTYSRESLDRLEAVKAALEIIKAGASGDNVGSVISFAKEEISNLADAIQAAVDKKK
ncbi:hypothetical protein [Brenneria populi]